MYVILRSVFYEWPRVILVLRRQRALELESDSMFLSPRCVGKDNS